MSQFSWEDMETLEKMVKDNYEDAVLINSLGKLQHYQIVLNEKISQI
jgi:nitrogen regulatory protein PII-like uncharacterized protein